MPEPQKVSRFSPFRLRFVWVWIGTLFGMFFHHELAKMATSTNFALSWGLIIAFVFGLLALALSRGTHNKDFLAGDILIPVALVTWGIGLYLAALPIGQLVFGLDPITTAPIRFQVIAFIMMAPLLIGSILGSRNSSRPQSPP